MIRIHYKVLPHEEVLIVKLDSADELEKWKNRYEHMGVRVIKEEELSEDES